MPIELRTGKPGNGKTAFLMVDLMADAKKAERPLFASGIDGLTPGLATVLEDPTKWNEIDPNGAPECTCDKHPDPHAHYLPNGAKWYVDEAWKWFGHLQSAARQVQPDHVLALAEHRHRGIDMVWTTQGPNQLYPFARPLIAEHRHYVRRYGTDFVDMWKWEEMQEEVKSAAKREAGMRSTLRLPKHVYGTYKSASEHTIKRRIPTQVLLVPVLILAFVAMIWGTLAWLSPDAQAGESTDAGAEAPAGAPTRAGTTAEARPKYETVADYVKAHTARIPAAPWTAPVYDDRSPQVDPTVVCMVAGAGEDANGEYRHETCSCLTEQGTRYIMDRMDCETVARTGGLYNPYREQREDRGDASQPPGQSQTTETAVPGVVLEAPPMTGYGDMPRATKAIPAT